MGAACCAAAEEPEGRSVDWGDEPPAPKLPKGQRREWKTSGSNVDTRGTRYGGGRSISLNRDSSRHIMIRGSIEEDESVLGGLGHAGTAMVPLHECFDLPRPSDRYRSMAVL